jgi:hypothetical protein
MRIATVRFVLVENTNGLPTRFTDAQYYKTLVEAVPKDWTLVGPNHEITKGHVDYRLSYGSQVTLRDHETGLEIVFGGIALGAAIKLVKALWNSHEAAARPHQHPTQTSTVLISCRDSARQTIRSTPSDDNLDQWMTSINQQCSP